MWHDISKEGYPKDSVTEYLLTDGEDYFIGNWRPDAKAWDNYTSGWVRKYIDETGSNDSLAKITHWMELPSLPNDEEILESINKIRDMLSNNTDKSDNVLNSLDNIETIVEKQIAVEPLDIGNDWGVYCPTCSMNNGEILQIVGRKESGDIEPMFDYCPHCGQKIKWNDN